ncbi:MAG: hypothetical protein IPI53_11385 [Saprospiraceae bacterium]|nr:hypothetical protein [Saprospiraceae bacterium]
MLHVGCVTVPVTGEEGREYTVNGRVLLHPSDVRVYVRITEPALSPDTTPAFVMVDIAVFEDDHTPPEEGVTLVFDPVHTAEAPPRVGADGIAFTVTFAEAGEDNC